MADVTTTEPAGETATAAVTLEPVARNFSLKDHVYAELRGAILGARIYDEATDLRLDERTLAEQLGISRTPVREAIARLAQEGLVEIVPRRGVFIVRKTRDEILEMITVWAALESMAARLAAERASDAEIAALRRLAAEFEKEDATTHVDEYSETNILFHQGILELGGCAMLKDIADGLFVHVRAVRSRAMHESDRASRSVTDHRAIIEAIEARDADLAAQRVRDHTMGLHEHVRRTWTDFSDATDRQGAVPAGHRGRES
jgi:DNA-binding GntR family transcriptional regulator